MKKVLHLVHAGRRSALVGGNPPNGVVGANTNHSCNFLKL